MKKYLLSAFAILSLLCVACGGGGDDAPTTVPVSGIKLDKSALSLEIGEKATVTATIAPADATNKSITWSTANQTIATVNNGVVEGVATGETTITAKTNDGGYSATIPVKVLPKTVKVTEIKLVGVPAETEKGRSTTFSAVITPADATDMSVTFTSSNPEVATVEFTKAESNYSLALLKAVGNGKATITATANDGSGVKAEAEINVIGVMPTSATVNGSNTLRLLTWHGKKIEVKPDMTPAGADLTKLNWTWNDGNWMNPVNHTLAADKITFESPLKHYPYQFESMGGGVAYDGTHVGHILNVTVYFRTKCEISYNIGSDGGLSDSHANTALQIAMEGSDKLQELPTLTRTSKTQYFEAFCAPLDYPCSASATTYYPNSYIPTTEYTLTSSDSTKWKVTRLNDRVYKIEDLDPTSYKEIILTYTCGDFSFDYKFKVTPL